MILLSTVAVSQQFSGSNCFSVLKLSLLTAWFIGGIFLFQLYKKTKHLLTDEYLSFHCA
jgi:hypothetical protein